MENRYYTPEIEEFCIGFECEIKNIIDTRINFTKRKEAILNYMLKIKFKGIRVKYLDKEDIESLGFKHLYDDFTFGEYFKSKCNIMNYNLNYDYLSNWLTISTVSKDDLIEYSTIFCGKILNKSEFKKLLIQLNIINE